MNARRPRIGLLGFFLEANRASPVTTREMFAASIDLAGAALLEGMRGATPLTLPDAVGFVADMDRAGAWTAVPLRALGAQPGGPADQAFFDEFLADLAARLEAALPLDGVFVSAHGAALATASDDPEGDLFERVRAIVGATVPVVAVFDLHANVSRRMTDNLSAFVAYRTNPHVDLHERGAEAAQILRSLMCGSEGVVEMVKLPFVPPATTQLTAPGRPYRRIIDYGQTLLGGSVVNVSACGGFALADCANCGFSVVVTAKDGDRAAARAAAMEVARTAWELRTEFRDSLISIDDAVALALQAGTGLAPPLLLADVADNPGGGGGGNTTYLLRALLEAGVQDALLGVFTDAALAAEAHRLGTGAQFEARFNRSSADVHARPFSAPARVRALCGGRFLGRRGLVRGTQREMGPAALLELGGVQVAVISVRQQLLDPAQLEVLGIELGRMRTLVAKGRGHFRAAFDEQFAPERVFEVDCPGLTSPVLRSRTWTRLPRPVYPIDENVSWAPPQARPVA